MRKHTAYLILILCTCARVSAAAGQGPDAHAQEPDTLLLDEVVVKADAPRQARSSAPLRTVDSRALERRGVTDVSDALHRMAGVNLRDYGGAGGLKTVSVRGLGASHTGVCYDGVPVGNAQSGQIDLSRYSLDAVGSVSLAVGDNEDIFIPARLAASAATVGINTMGAEGARELSLKLRTGSFGYINPFLRATLPVGENLWLNATGEYTHAENDYPFTLRNGNLVTRERRTNSRMNSGHAEINALWRPSATTSLKAKTYYYNNHRRLPGPVIYYNDDNRERLHEENAMGQLCLQISPGGDVSLKGIAKYSFSSSLYHDENGKYPGGRLDQNYWQREAYTSWALLFNCGRGWLLDYSADYSYNTLNSNLASDRRPYRHSLLQSATAKYSNSRITITARLLASVYLNGARRLTAARDARRLSPSASLSWRPFASQLLYLRASYKNIFRMPTFNEAYFDHLGSADILPESTDQLNLGLTYTLRPSGVLTQAVVTVDGYLNHVHDMIVAVPYNMFVWSMVNLGKVRATGLEVTAEASASAGRGHTLSLAANYSYQRAMPLTDPASPEWKKQVAYIPRHSGSASLSYENPWANLSLSLTGVSARYTTNTNAPATRIAGYAELGATAWRNFKLGSLRIGCRLDVLNLLDKQYSVVARYPMPGRQYRATISVDF